MANVLQSVLDLKTYFSFATWVLHHHQPFNVPTSGPQAYLMD
jgi:hypothetical protein